MSWVFAFSLFASALLLFLLQPMIGKLILPKFGGTPAVWITCMLFFQTMLTAGYAYAHWTPARLGVARQARLHVWLLLSPLLVLPLAWTLLPFAAAPLGIAPDWAPPGDAAPQPYLLLLLGLSVGLPFFILATSAPLLQKWFAASGRPSSHDPYYLYAASNLGSMAALLSYPVLIEPLVGLNKQGWAWLVGYGLFVLLIGWCIVLMQRALAELPAKLLEIGGTAPAPAFETAILAPEVQVQAGPLAPLEPPFEAEPAAEMPVTPLQRLLWVTRAFVPSSMMLGLTTYFTTDVAPVPLLWLIPLAVYLLTFIIAFGRMPALVHKFFVQGMPGHVLLLVFVLQADWVRSSLSLPVQFAVHLAVFFGIAMACHGELAYTRPAAHYLTEFYLWISLGGTLGGLFNALVAPLLFVRVAEYPLALVLAALVLPPLVVGRLIRWRWVIDIPWAVILLVSAGLLLLGRIQAGTLDLDILAHVPLEDALGLGALKAICPIGIGLSALLGKRERLNRILDFVVPLVIACWTAAFLAADATQTGVVRMLCVVAFFTALAMLGLAVAFSDAGQTGRLLHLVWPLLLVGTLPLLYLRHSVTSEALQLILPLLLVSMCVDRPIRFGLALAFVLLLFTVVDDSNSDRLLLHRKRSFFGIYAVEKRGPHHRLLHGTTLHGVQNVGSSEPLSYYHRTSPVGEVLDELERQGKSPPLAVIGLGVGTMAGHGRPGQEVTFYEIDPAMIQIARNPAYFTYVSDAEQRGVKLQIVLGDGRLQLARAPDRHYGLIVVDAFSSDAIPTHLFTREALQLYLQKLAPGGIVAFHISNRYLNLQKVLATLVADAGATALQRFDSAEFVPGKYSSDWVMVAKSDDDFGELLDRPGWFPVVPLPNQPMWTDDFTNLLSVFRWRKERE